MEANLRRRILTALVIVPPLIFAVGWAPPWVFTALVLSLTCVALFEYFNIALPQHPGERKLGILFGLSVWAFVVMAQIIDLGLWLAFLLVLVFTRYLFVSGELNDRLFRLGRLLLGSCYVGLLMPAWILLFRFPDGRSWIFFVLGVSVAGDTAAYFVGRRFGIKKLAPEISPGKTRAGAWAYIAGGVTVGVMAGGFVFTDYPFIEILCMALLFAVFAQVGDLFESLLKRVFGVKDSSSFLPGHGGILDRLDSLMFPAVLANAYLKVFHP